MRSRTCRSGRVGRSAGLASPLVVPALPRSRTVVRVLAVACTSALVFIPTTAHAQSTQDRIAQTRQRINDVAQQWFTTQADAARIDADIADLEQRLASARAREEIAAHVATQRAIVMYKGASSTIPEMTGTDAMDSARRVELIDRANADNRRALDELDAATQDLTAQRDALGARRADQARTLDELASERASLDNDLASLNENARREAAAAATARANAANAAARAQSQARPRVSTRASAPTRPANVAAPAVATAVVTPTAARQYEPAPRRPLPDLHPGPGGRRDLLGGQPGRLLRRLPIRPHHLGRHRRRGPGGWISWGCCRRRRRPPTRTRWPGFSTSGRASSPGTGAAERVIRCGREARGPAGRTRPARLQSASDESRRSAPD